MRRRKYLRPDTAARSVCEIDYHIFHDNGFRLVLLDLDNTLSAHGSTHPDDFAREAIRLIREAGLKPALVTNAKKSRGLAFAADLDIPVIPLAGKPLARKIKALIQEMGFTPKQTLMIGDQIFTDVLAARQAGTYSILVLPRFQEEAWNVRLKRWLEKPFLRNVHFPE